MAGTMPHAVFVETDLANGGCAAYAAELPGCASFAATDAEAVADIPRRVDQFTAWLRERGERVPSFAGGNWYEVERASAGAGGGGRAAFSLDELPPSDDEFAAWLRWLELSREELADALDEAGYDAASGELAAVERQDLAFVEVLRGQAPAQHKDPVDRLYAARDALTEALEAAGSTADGVRRVLRLAIADDLRAADRLREAAPPAA
jgi:hypothetical protein